MDGKSRWRNMTQWTTVKEEEGELQEDKRREGRRKNSHTSKEGSIGRGTDIRGVIEDKHGSQE